MILGAGIAGITAAKTLYDKGIRDFLILEGQDYIGGRIRNLPFADVRIEEGANWIHFSDEEDNPLTALKDQQNYPGTLSNYSDMIMR